MLSQGPLSSSPLSDAELPTTAIIGTAALTFTQSATLTTGLGSSSSPGLPFLSTLMEPNGYNLTGVCSLIFGQSSTLTGSGAMVGSSALTFGQGSTLTGSGSLTGTNALTFTQSGNLKGDGALGGASLVVFTQTGSLTGDAALLGTCAISFTQYGNIHVLAPVWPAESDVRFGIVYGPTGAEYTGSLSGGGGSFMRRR